MKRLFLLLTTIVALSCSKETCTEYLIKNSSNLDLILKFKRVDNLFNKNIQNKRAVNFGDISCGFEGITPITLELNDSIYITSISNKILKVFKEDTPGKNIYKIDEFWTLEETSKDHFVYTYEITEADLE